MTTDTTTAAPPPADPSPLLLRKLMGRYTGPRDLDGQLRLADALAKAKRSIPWQYRDNPGDILAVIQHAVSLDIELAVAIDNLVFSDTGVGGMRGRLIHALLIRAGHEVIPTHHDDRLCRMILKRGDGRRGGGAQWTLTEARAAGLLNKDRTPWRAYGGDMLWWRCLSRLARRYAPEVIMGFYAAEELDDLPTDALDSFDMSTTVLDLDGNPTPAPDVVNLLTDVDTLDLAGLRNRWAMANEAGQLGAFAGVVDGVDMTVRDILFGLLAAKDDVQAEAAHGVQPQDLDAIAAELRAAYPADGDTTADEGDEDLPDDGDDAPAGVGRMSCGCTAATVLAANGRHEDGCTLPPRETR